MALRRSLPLPLLPLLLLLPSLLSPPAPTLAAAPSSASLSPCPTTCGSIPIPYPFGLADGCSRPEFLLSCNASTTPPFPYIPSISTPAPNVTLDFLVINASIAMDCYKPLNLPRKGKTIQTLDLSLAPYTFSYARNKFTALGCDTLGLNSFNVSSGLGGCSSTCALRSDIIDGSCTGYGCCQTSLPKGMKNIIFSVGAARNHTTTWNISPCSYAFVIDQEEFTFEAADLTEFYERDAVPVVLDWAIGKETCEVAARSGDYACGDNSHCVNSTNGPGYRCSCNKGFAGNPYIADGCQDINECKDPSQNTCSDICTNTPGGFVCSCPSGTYGDGLKSGKSCIKESKRFPLLQVILGCGLGFLFLLVTSSWLYWAMKKRRLIKLKEKFFKQNGGYLLRQQLTTSQEDATEIAKIFSAEELERATDGYSEARVLGRGGYGTVYKGVLPDKRVVAIKRSKVVDDESQLEQFINEIVILSQVIHRNVVKILGCCLETQVPLLVYEYIPNGTLFYHLHDPKRVGSLSWEVRVRIAAETAEAIAYLHNFAARPIFHRDIKSANILLDSNFTAKVADFGASRMVSLDQIQVTTLVQGTLGYLDPEYFHTGQLTAQSDVYSFGVVLAELLTGECSISQERDKEVRNLTAYFLKAIREDSLLNVLEPRVLREGDPNQVQKVVEVTKQCLMLKGEERPTMKEVAAELGRLRGRKRVAERSQSTEKIRDNYKGYINGVFAGNSSASFSTGTTVAGGEGSATIDWSEYQR